MACAGCGESVALGARFCSVCGRAVSLVSVPPPPATRNSLLTSSGNGLFRPRERRMLAGVCAGFALRYGWDVSVVRLVLVLALVFGAGTPVIAYLIAWVIMPNGQYALPSEVTSGRAGSIRV